MNWKTKLRNMFYGKPEVVRTVQLESIATVTIAADPPKQLKVPLVKDVYKRPRHSNEWLGDAHLRLPYAIPVAHNITVKYPYYFGDEDEEQS